MPAIGRARRRAACRRPRPGRRAAGAWRPGRARRTRSGSSARRARPTRAGTRALADELGVRRDRRLEIGEQLGPDRHDRVGPRRARGTRRGSAGSARRDSSSLESAPEAPEEAGAVAGVAGPVAVLVDLEQQHVGVAVVVRLARRPGGRRSCRPCARPPGGCGSSRPSAPRRASCAASRRSSRRTSARRRVGVLGDAGTSPSASNLTAGELLVRDGRRRSPLTGTAPSTPRCARRRRRGGRARAA